MIRKKTQKGKPASPDHPNVGGRLPDSPPRQRKAAAARAAAATSGTPLEEPYYVLRLYIAGVTSRSTTAVANLKSICEEHLKGRYQLDVVDIYQQPSLASTAQITAVPTLIRKLPLPLRRIVGDMSHKDRVLVGLEMTEHR